MSYVILVGMVRGTSKVFPCIRFVSSRSYLIRIPVQQKSTKWSIFRTLSRAIATTTPRRSRRTEIGVIQDDIIEPVKNNCFTNSQNESWLFDPLSFHIRTAVMRLIPPKQWMDNQDKWNTFVRRSLRSQEDIVDQKWVWHGIGICLPTTRNKACLYTYT